MHLILKTLNLYCSISYEIKLYSVSELRDDGHSFNGCLADTGFRQIKLLINYKLNY